MKLLVRVLGFCTYRRVRILRQAQVFLLFICDTVNCCFDVAFLYIPLVNNFGESRYSFAHICPDGSISGNNDAISRASWSEYLRHARLVCTTHDRVSICYRCGLRRLISYTHHKLSESFLHDQIHL